MIHIFVAGRRLGPFRLRAMGQYARFWGRWCPVDRRRH